MDPNLIPTLAGSVLLVAVWLSAILGRIYVRRLQKADEREGE